MKNNDKTLLKIGFFLLLVFIFYSYNGQSFIALLEKVGGLGEIKADADVAKNIAVITHVFMISVIAMFIGTPLSRTLNAIIIKNSHRYNLIKIPQLNKRASKEWSKVVDVLEHHQYTPLLVKLRQLGIQDKFEISTENSFTILPSFLHRASDLLFRIVDSLDEIISRDKNDRKILINYQKTITILRKEVRRLRYKNEIVKSLLLFVVILFPFCIALLIFGLCELPLSAENYRRECKLVIGVGLIFLSYPSALLFHYVIGFISAKIWRGESTVYDDFIFNVYSFIFSSVVFSAIVYSGVSYLAEIKGMLNFYSSLFLPSHDISTVDQAVRKLFEANIHFLIISISTLILSYLLYLVIIFLVKKYEHYFYSPNSSDYVIPPELIKIFGIFLVFILSSAMLYTALSGYILRDKIVVIAVCKSKTVNTEKSVKGNSSEERSDNTGKSKDNKSGKKGGGCVEPDEKSGANNDQGSSEKSSRGEMTDYIPYSIFLAIVGTILAVSTRDLLENYFAGLSLRVNLPFEEGDRVTINNSEMLEVRRVGVRSNEFYGIKTNTIRNIPHKLISNFTVVNYTHPTLDYRKHIKIYVTSGRVGDDNVGNVGTSILEQAEKLLLLSAYFSKGVKLPNIEGLGELSEEKKKNDEHVVWNDIQNNVVIRKNLFIEKIPSIISRAAPSGKNKEGYNNIINEVKKTILSIVYRKKRFDEFKEKFDRKKSNPTESSDITNNILKEMEMLPVDMSYDYFLIAEKRWRLKEFHNSISVKRTIDSAGISLLDAPRVTSNHQTIDGKPGWEVELIVTVELEEQSDEVVHHINRHIADMWDVFGLPKRISDS